MICVFGATCSAPPCRTSQIAASRKGWTCRPWRQRTEPSGKSSSRDSAKNTIASGGGVAFNGFADTPEVTGEVWRGPKTLLMFRYRWLFTSIVDALVRFPTAARRDMLPNQRLPDYPHRERYTTDEASLRGAPPTRHIRALRRATMCGVRRSRRSPLTGVAARYVRGLMSDTAP